MLGPKPVCASRVVVPVLITTLSACAEPQGRDLLLVTLDTFRADHLSALGDSPVQTPGLDALGSRGAVFERHYSVANVTGPSHASMLTGKFPRELGMRRNGNPLSDRFPSLPEELGDEGFTTAAFLSAGVLSSEYGFDRGFDRFDEDFGFENGDPIYERAGEETVALARDWLAQESGEAGIFLWVHLFDAHLPHRSLDPIRVRPEPSFAGETWTESERLQQQEWFGASYAAEVARVDRLCAELDHMWSQRAGSRGSFMAFTSDHGEGLWEHDYLGHSLQLYQMQIHVPLILVAPGRIAPGTRIEGPTGAVELAGTLWNGAIPRSKGEVFGPGLWGLLDGTGAPSRRVIAEQFAMPGWLRHLRGENGTDDPRNASKFAVMEDDLKYIWNEAGPAEFFRLADDPGERTNLAESYPDRVASWDRKRERYLASTPTARGASASKKPQTQEMLNALGYTEE